MQARVRGRNNRLAPEIESNAKCVRWKATYPVVKNLELLVVKRRVVRHGVLRLEAGHAEATRAILAGEDIVPLANLCEGHKGADQRVRRDEKQVRLVLTVHLTLRRDVKDSALDGDVDRLAGVGTVKLLELLDGDRVVLGRAERRASPVVSIIADRPENTERSNLLSRGGSRLHHLGSCNM